ncbi:hypothetical protein HYR54_03130 [Candidatus Acetothermia bacterium]|nr:hypothetical protein [Candidatus Acetothermia bacterium]
MQKFSMLFVFTSLVAQVLLATPTVLAAPTLFQCSLPSATVGLLDPKAPAPLPKSGELVIKFQRALAESTQTAIKFAEIKDHTLLIDRIVKAITDEAAQHAPKMAAVRERGLDEIKTQTLGSFRFVLLNELLRFLMVYDAAEIQTIFDGTAAGGYTPICSALAPMREVPSFPDISFESKPKILFIAFPERVRGSQAATGAVIYTDKEDDVNSLGIRYRSEDSSVKDFVSIPYEIAPVPSPFGPGLKAVKFQLILPCEASLAFEATAFLSDSLGFNSEFFTFKFVCEG